MKDIPDNEVHVDSDCEFGTADLLLTECFHGLQKLMCLESRKPNNKSLGENHPSFKNIFSLHSSPAVVSTLFASSDEF